VIPQVDNRCVHCDEPVRGLPRFDADADGTHSLSAQSLPSEQFCCSGCEIAYHAIQSMFDQPEGSNPFYDLAKGNLRPPTQGKVDSIQALRDSIQMKDSLSSAEWYLEGVHCRACVWLVDQMPRAVDGVVSARTDISSNLLRLEWDPEKTSVDDIVNWLQPLGYSPHPTKTKEEGGALLSVGASALLAMNAMMVSVTSYGGLSAENDYEVWRFLSIAAGIMATASLYLFRFRILRLIKSIKLAKLPVDLPIVIGIIAAWFFSWFNLYTTQAGVKGGELWFDAICVLVALLLATEWYTDRTRRRIGQFTQVDFSIVPEFTTLKIGKRIHRDEVQVDDLLVCEPNAVLVSDGIAQQNMFVDRSVQTGESLPINIAKGDDLYAGDRVLAQHSPEGMFYRVKVRHEKSKLALLLESLKSPEYLDSDVVDRAEKLSSLFVKIVLILALLASIISVIFLGEFGAVIAILIVACPCGLAIATPLSYAIGMGQIRRKGVLLKSAQGIDILDRATDIVFDKTGTLTDGDFRMQGYQSTAEHLRIANALEFFSSHPLSTAFSKNADDLELDEVCADRLGVSAKVGSGSYRVMGSQKRIPAAYKDFIAIGLFAMSGGKTSGEDGQELATFYVGDALRPESPQVIKALKADGLHVHVLSGDREDKVQHVCADLDIATFRSSLSPEEKASYIRELKDKGRVVLFLGDGTNDALACLEADASFVVKGASPITFSLAEGLLDTRNLGSFLDAKLFAARVRKRTTFALVWALIYNIVMLAASAIGWITPLIAAIAMPLSSAILVLITTSGSQLGSILSQSLPGRREASSDDAKAVLEPVFHAKPTESVPL